MGFLDNAKDFLNGATPAKKKKCSAFLSAALLYLPEFKIDSISEFGDEVKIYSINGNKRLELSIKPNKFKINELKTTIYYFLRDSTFDYITKFSPLEVEFTYTHFKANTSVKPAKMEETFVDLLSDRSYVKYLLAQENQLFIQQSTNIDTNFYAANITRNSLHYHSHLEDPLLIKDSLFKKVNHQERVMLAHISDYIHGNFSYDIYRRKKTYSARNGYLTKDVWHLKLTVILSDRVVFEEISLSDGKNGLNNVMHEDDFLSFSDSFNRMFQNWNNSNKNY
jgi:hypothetical protein